jgi:hypothetical protein
VRWYRTLAPTTPPPMTTTWADDFTETPPRIRTREAYARTADQCVSLR